MIETLTIENFKCFVEKTEIKLAPITLLFGENSSGKSAVLKALETLRDIQLGLKGPECPSFPFPDVVAGKNLDKKIVLGFCRSAGLAEWRHHDGYCMEWDSENWRHALSWNTRLSWDKVKHQTKIDEIDIPAGMSEVPAFILGYNKPIEVSQQLDKKLVDDAVELFLTHVDELKAGLERFVECTVMEEYLLAHPDEVRAILDAHEPCLPCAHGEPLNMLSPDNLPVLPLQMPKNIEMKEERKRQAYALRASWREGLPEWIKDCPPSWLAYRKSEDFSKRTKSLLAGRFCSLREFCHEPSREKLGKIAIQIRFPFNNFSMPVVSIDPTIKDILRIMGSDCVSISTGGQSGFERKVDVDVYQERPDSGDLSDVRRKLELEVQRKEKLVRSSLDRRCEEAQEFVQSVVSISPLRDQPQRIYSYAEPTTSLPRLLAENKDNLCDEVNVWLKKLGVDYEVKIHRLDAEGYFQLLLKDSRNPSPVCVNYADVGYGISQILPVLVAGLTGKNSIILIDEPEQHIHPRLQAELGSFFAECRRERGHQFIVATHSEYLMLRLQRLIREQSLSSGEVALKYVVRTETGSKVQSLNLNENGEFIAGWPEGFMPDRLEELV